MNEGKFVEWLYACINSIGLSQVLDLDIKLFQIRFVNKTCNYCK